MRKGLYLSPLAKNQKNKGTLLSQTLKVEEKKVPLFFLFFGQGAEILPFSHYFWDILALKRNKTAISPSMGQKSKK